MNFDPDYDLWENPETTHSLEQVDQLRKKNHLKSVSQEIKSKIGEKVDPVSEKQDRFQRLIRDGVALEIRNAILEAKRELDQHQKLGRFTKTSHQMADEFRKMGDGYLQRKLVLEKLENGIEALRSKLETVSTPSLELKLQHAIDNANKIVNECKLISDRLVIFRDRIEQQVRKDQKQEQSLKDTFERCLSHLSKLERGKLNVSIKHKAEQLPIEHRITLYSQMIQQFAQKIPAIRDEEITRLFELAEKNYEQKNNKEALGLLDQVFKFDKQHLPGHRIRAEIYKAIGNKVAYMCELRMIVKIDLAEARDFFGMADVLSESGQLEEAYEFYEQAVSKDPNIKYLERLGDVSFELRRWFRAIQVYQQILKQSPYLGRVLHKYGRSLLENEREEEAFNILRQAIQIKDDNSHSRVCAGRIYRRRAAFDDASDSFKRAIELDDGNVEAYYWWGAMLLDRGEFDDALKSAQVAVDLDTKRVRNRLLLAKALGAIARFDEALSALEPCLAADIPSVDVLLTYSEMCRNSKQVEKGLDLIGKFLKRFPRQPQIRAEYGILLVQAGRLEESNEFLQPPGMALAKKAG